MYKGTATFIVDIKGRFPSKENQLDDERFLDMDKVWEIIYKALEPYALELEDITEDPKSYDTLSYEREC